MAHGGPEVLELVDLSEVKALAGQIRIRNYAAAVNPTDVVARNGTLAKYRKKPAALRAGNGCRGHCRPGG